MYLPPCPRLWIRKNKLCCRISTAIAINTLSERCELRTHVSSLSDNVLHGVPSIHIYTEKRFLWIIATRAETDNEIKVQRIKTISGGWGGEVWRTLDRLQFECMLSRRRTTWAIEAQPDSPEPSVSLPLLRDPIPPRFSNCLSKFCTNYQNGKGFLAAWIPFAISRLVGIYFAWSCRTEATFWWGRVEVNTSVKTMTDAVARYKFTMASSLSSNCQQHQRASGEPSAKMRWEGWRGGEKRADEEKGSRVCNSVYYAAEEFAWELGLTD